MIEPQPTVAVPPSTPVRIRVAAIIVRDGAVLMVRHEKDGRSYWMLPGGGLDHGETLAEALARELREELNLEISVKDLALVNDTIAPDKHRHILNLYFTADIVSGEAVLGSDERVVEVAWQPVETLGTLSMYPDFAGIVQSLIRGEYSRHAAYLGNIWT